MEEHIINYFNTYPFVVIFTSNQNTEGFKNQLVLSNHLSSRIDSSKNQVVFISYDFKNSIEKFKEKLNNPLLFPETIIFDIEKEINISHITFKEQQNTTQKHIKIKPTVSKEQYIHNVKQLKQHIQLGDIYEINYCITFEAKNVTIDPIAIYQKLNSISKAPYSALAKFNKQYIISSSPELFLSKKGNTLITKPIKGTAKRSAKQLEDEILKNELQNNLKERTENVMIVDVARNDLSRIAKKGTVVVDKLYDIESYQQVHQMVSTVSCKLNEDTSFKNIINSTFPMASMTGAPKIRAMELIDDFELYNRSAYSGALGYIEKNGDFDLSVLIRSIFYNEETQYLSFSVGSAITAMCNPEDEYEECLLKAKAMMQVLEGKN